MAYSPPMRVDRFFSDRIEGDRIILYGEENHHATKVLRKRKGDIVSVFDGRGREFIARIEETGKSQSILKILEEVPPREYPFHIAIAQALIKHNRWDWMLEKVTEIGVKEIVPLITEFSVVRTQSKKGRWEKIVLNACKQSGRQIIPAIQSPMDINQLIEHSRDYGSRLVAHPGGVEIIEAPISEKILIAIGPEGGFSDEEIGKLEEANFVKVNLGNFILRSETAPVYAASVIVQRLILHLRG